MAFDPAQKRATTQSLRGGFGAPQSFEWGQAATPVLGTACAHPCSRRQTLSSIRRARALCAGRRDRAIARARSPAAASRRPAGLAALGTGPYGTHNGSRIVLTRSIYLSDTAEGQASVAAVTSSSSWQALQSGRACQRGPGQQLSAARVEGSCCSRCWELQVVLWL